MSQVYFIQSADDVICARGYQKQLVNFYNLPVEGENRMARTKLAKNAERLIYGHTTKMGTFDCFEVTLG